MTPLLRAKHVKAGTNGRAGKPAQQGTLGHVVDIITTAKANGTPILHAVHAAVGLPAPRKGESTQLRFTLPKSTLAEIEALAEEHGVTPEELVAALLGVRAAEAKPLTVPPEAAKLMRQCAAILALDAQDFCNRWLGQWSHLLDPTDEDGDLVDWVACRVRGFTFRTREDQEAARKRFADGLRAAGVKKTELARRMKAAAPYWH